MNFISIYKELLATETDKIKIAIIKDAIAYHEGKKPYTCPHCGREVPNKLNDYCSKCV